MKPAPFEYVRPSNIDEACALLAADTGSRLIAGGQTLAPLMAIRLARPTRLIDIARIPELSFLHEQGDEIAIGAATRQCLVENNPLIHRKLPLLSKVIPFVGHPATRARGTVGGSIANADPAAEISLVAVTLGATMIYRDGKTTHKIQAHEFFVGPMVSALTPSSCLLEVRFPIWRERHLGVGFHEINARRSDFAFAAAAAQVALDSNGACRRLTVGIGAVAPVPLRLETMSRALDGERIDEAKIRAAAEAALAEIEPLSDLHASADYRRRAAVTLVVRAILDAARVAGESHAR